MNYKKIIIHSFSSSNNIFFIKKQGMGVKELSSFHINIKEYGR